MSDTTELTGQLCVVQGTDGCAPSVDDGNEVTLLMHKVTVQEVPSNKEHVSSVTYVQTDSGKCTTTGRLLFEENLIILSKIVEDSLHFELEREPDGENGAFDEHEAYICFGTFDEAGKFDADGKAHMQEDELTNFADEQDASIRAQMLGVGVGVRIKNTASEMPMEKRLQRLVESSHDNHDDVEGSLEEDNLEDSSHPKIIWSRLFFNFLLLLSACVSTDYVRCVFKWMLSNTIVTRDWRTSFHGSFLLIPAMFVPGPCLFTQTSGRYERLISQINATSAATTARTTTPATAASTTLTVYVKTISGKTIIVKCDKKQRAATTAETVERKAAIPRDMMYLVNQGKVLNEKKTIEANNIGNDTTVVMSSRLLGGMEKNEQMDTQGTEEDRERKRKFEEAKEGKVLKPSDDAVYLRRDIMEASKRSDEKMDRYKQFNERITNIGKSLTWIKNTEIELKKPKENMWIRIKAKQW